VKKWAFMKAPAAGNFEMSEYKLNRTQAFFRPDDGTTNEYALVESFSGAEWKYATWVDTWHLRYDGTTVIEFKDDANYKTALGNPTQGIEFGSTVFESGRELRWGNQLSAGVSNPSPSRGYSSSFVVDGGTLVPSRPSFEGRADNAFTLVDVRDNVIANGRRFDRVAKVRIDQRACASAAADGCAYNAQGTAAYNVAYFYLAPDTGFIAIIFYDAQKASPDAGALAFDGGFDIKLSSGEVLTDTCIKPAPAVRQYDWQFAYDSTLTASPPVPTCP
jgi:hypothetical protein